jgi:hypothetical protein
VPGAVAGATDVPLEVFGGLVTQFAPSDLPMGASPDCQDVAFLPGRVQTRPGLARVLTTGGNTVNYVKTYITSNGLLRTLVLDKTGGLWVEDATAAPGTLNIITNTILANCYARSVTLFGREYIAFSDGVAGRDIPRQYNDTNLDRISQGGPGGAPNAADENLSANIVASPGGLLQFVRTVSTVTEVGNIVTVTVTASDSGNSRAGDIVVIAGVPVGGYNGTFTIATVISGISFTYINNNTGLGASGGGTVNYGLTTVNLTAPAPAGFANLNSLVQIAGAGVAGYLGIWTVRTAAAGGTSFVIYVSTLSLANSGNGSASQAGNIGAGIHQISVMFLTRNGYLTEPAPPTSWNAQGNRRVVVSSIPTGPPNIIVARVLIFTLANGSNFYYLATGVPQINSSAMQINDNTTTTITIDFSDAILAAGTNADNQFNLITLTEVANIQDYNDRLFTLGGYNTIQNMLNMGFDGGTYLFIGNLVPLGWVDNGGAAVRSVSYTQALYGGALSFSGGAGVTQQTYQDFRNVAILTPNVGYSFRVRMKFSTLSATGQVNFSIVGSSAPDFIVLASTITTSYGLFSGTLCTGAQLPTTVGTSLSVNTGGPVFSGGAILYVDELEIYPTLQAFTSSTVFASYAEQAESFNGVTGIMQIAPYNGQRLTSFFKLRGNIYFVKERSFFYSKDDSTNEPSLWAVEQVSAKVGSLSVNGTAFGEDWAIIAAVDGPYIFWGPEPVKIGQEIQPTWDTINWAAGPTMWTAIDVQKKRILFGVPTGNATSPNTVLALDYSYLLNATDIAEYQSIHSSSYTGKNIDIDKSRKWAPWTISGNSAAFVQRNTGTALVFIGAGAYGSLANSGLVYQLSDTALTDDPSPGLNVPIPGYYTTFFFLEHQIEQQLQLGSHRKLFVYLTMYIQGNGNISLTSFLDNLSFPSQLPTLTLNNPALRDTELPINIQSYRVAFKIASSGSGSWFHLEKFVPSLMRHPWSEVRGSTN